MDRMMPLEATRRRRWLVAVVAVLGLSAALALFWSWALRLDPSASERDLLVANPALALPRPPRGLVVLAEPGEWARLVARVPARRALLDPRWWSELLGGGAVPPAEVASGFTVAALSQFPHSLVVAWWDEGWLVQGRVRGGRLVGERGFERLLPEGWHGRTAMRDGILRVASTPVLAEGWSWRPAVRARRWWRGGLAGWGEVGGRQWRATFEHGVLILRSGSPVRAARSPRLAGAAAARVEDGRRLLTALNLRLPEGGMLGGMNVELERALERPMLLWMRAVEPAQPLPRLHLGLHLAWRDDEATAAARTAAANEVRRVLCPLACAVEPAPGGDPALERWRSPVVSWWVRREISGLVLATGREELAALAGEVAPGAPEHAGWAVVDGPEAAAVAAELVQSQLLAGLGMIASDRVRLLRFAAPVAGFGGLTWAHAEDGHEVRIQF